LVATALEVCQLCWAVPQVAIWVTGLAHAVEERQRMALLCWEVLGVSNVVKGRRNPGAQACARVVGW